jgi:hypothetical protein
MVSTSLHCLASVFLGSAWGWQQLVARHG